MLSDGDIHYLSYDDIKTVFKNHSSVARKKGRVVKARLVPLLPQLPSRMRLGTSCRTLKAKLCIPFL